MAPRWKSTTIFFWRGPAVAATARCRKDGSEAIPSMAMPPFFRKYLREIFMVLSDMIEPLNQRRIRYRR
jgi:hypothetical protein